MNRKRFSTPEELVALDDVISRIADNTLSIRGGARELEETTGKYISHEGLRKILLGIKSVEDIDGDDDQTLGG